MNVIIFLHCHYKSSLRKLRGLLFLSTNCKRMKKIYQKCNFIRSMGFLILTGFFILSLVQKSNAQTNLALSATANHSGGGQISTGYGPPLYNDNVIKTYNTGGTYNWGWVSTNGWIDFTWTAAKTITKVVFYKDNRPMTTCVFQYWNGSTFVDFYTYSNSAIQDSVTFSPISTTILRFRNVAGSSNPNHREIRIFGPTKPNDVGISAITKPLCSPTLTVTYSNIGINTVDSVKINWSVNGVLQTQNRYNTSMAPGTSKNVTLSPDYNFVDGSNYDLKVWTSLPNNKVDSFNANDTARLSFRYLGPSGTPTVSDVIKCGPGRAPLEATPIYQTDSIVWYDAATGGNLIARGKKALSPPLVLGTNTFYAQAFKIGSPSSLANAMSGTTILSGNTGSYNGTMINLTPLEDIVLDSFAITFYQSTPNSTYEIWYRQGGYTGNERTPSAWTFVNSGAARIANVSGRNRGFLKFPELALTKGVAYSFYITTTPTTGNDLYATGGTSTYANADLTITGGTYIYGQWASNGIYTNYNPDLTTFYRKVSCPSSRVACKVTVKPSPAGGAFIKGTPFTSPVLNSNGFKNNPDIVAAKDQLTYELTPPTGYANSGYNTTWIAKNLTLRTNSGRVLPSGYYTWSNPGSGNGKITFTPDSTLTDSTITMTLSLNDLGPWFCDSTLTRFIFVAPRPVPDFTFNQPVCDGDNVVFDNSSRISSGGMKYRWDFGTGNPADTSDAYTTLFKFPTYGSYNVTLRTTSLPYGYVVSKTIKVVVTEIPKIDFKVVNACEGNAVSFINNTTHSGTVTYAWDFGDPGTTLDRSSNKTPVWTYAQPGGYKVTLKATANGCTSELTKNANQFARPKAFFSVPSLICDKSDVKFTNGSSIKSGYMGYKWSFGDGGISTFANPTHNYSNALSKTVKLLAVSEFGCADSFTRTITLNESPKADFTWDAACNLTQTNFTFTGTRPAAPVLTTFLWSYGGEGISGSSTQENPSKLFDVVGRKKATLTLTSNNGCSNSITKDIVVKLQSKADFVSNDVCEDDDAVFTNKSTVSLGNLNYKWKFGDGNNSASQSPRHRYNIAGTSQTFNVTLVAIVPGGCSDSITKAVTVNANPDAGFTFTTSGRLVYFKANQPGATLYQWRFGDGGNSNIANPSYNYLEWPKGKYTACLAVVNAAGCFSETCQSVLITGSVNKLTRLEGIDVYPNPNKGQFTLSVENPKSDLAIEILNLLGERIEKVDANPFKSVYELNLDVASGVYLIKVTNGGLTATRKITVSK